MFSFYYIKTHICISNKNKLSKMRNVSKTITKQVFFTRDLNTNREPLLFLVDGKQWGESRDYRLHTEIHVIVYGTLKVRKHVSFSLSLSTILSILSRCATINIDRISFNRFDTDE